MPARRLIFPLVCFAFLQRTLSVKSYRVDTPKKCCTVGYLFNEDLECVKQEERDFLAEDMSQERNDSDWSGQKSSIAIILTYDTPCTFNRSRKYTYNSTLSYSSPSIPRDFCIESVINGTEILIRCPKVKQRDFPGERNRTEDPKNETNGGLGTIVFWGAQTYMRTNMAHMFLCFVVVVIYFYVPDLGKSVHNRAVLRHNVSLLMLGCILSFLGFCDLCDCPIDSNVMIFLWLLLQYFTVATVFWLNVICFDMTLSITQFRWNQAPGARTEADDNRRLLFYGIFAWGGAFLPSGLAAIFEYCPGIPESFPLKPNYLRYRMGPNPTVNLYFFGVPLLTLFCNNVLFLFTTYKIIRTQRSTKIATKNQKHALRKKYLLFLRLYLLMGAPWFFGSLFACLNKLVTLKICRLIQPLLWLLMLIARKKTRRKIARKLGLRKTEDSQRPDAHP